MKVFLISALVIAGLALAITGIRFLCESVQRRREAKEQEQIAACMFLLDEIHEEPESRRAN